MKITRSRIEPIDFHGLEIADYTAGSRASSSIAEISIHPGVAHRKAYSKRSDKYNYVVSGHVQFRVDNESYDLAPGDVCVILKEQRFSYQNMSGEPAKVVLVHTPSFDIESEVFEE